MKDALKLYYKYMPKWLLGYSLIRELFGAGGSVFASIILPSAIAGCFTNQISYGVLLIILFVNLLLILLMPTFLNETKIRHKIYYKK